MFKTILILFISLSSFAGGNFHRQAKEIAYKNPTLLSTTLVESLTHKCTHYITVDKPSFYKKLYVLNCYHSVKSLFKTLDLYAFEVEKGTVLPISFSKKLLEFANNKNILTFLKFFNTLVPDQKINFLKSKVPELLSQYTNFDEFISVLFQDTSPSHLLFLRKFAPQEAYEIISQSNRVFFQSLQDEKERMTLFNDIAPINNPYHFYVIRHLSKVLTNQFNYELGAFVAYLFNYSYEIFENDFKTSYLFNDPEKVSEQNHEDFILGLKGAYFKDSIDSQFAQKKITNSNLEFLKFLGHRVLKH